MKPSDYFGLLSGKGTRRLVGRVQARVHLPEHCFDVFLLFGHVHACGHHRFGGILHTDW